MAIKSQVNELLNKKMDRQDFLKSIAIGMVAISGAGAALRLLAPSQKTANPSNTMGYGASAYGGSKEK
jgi:hypothetical protein